MAINKKIESHVAVYEELKIFRTTNTLKLALFPHIEGLFDDVDTNKVLIINNLTNRGNTKGITQDKGISRQELIDAIIMNAGPSSSYYFKENNMILYNELHYPTYILNKMTPVDLVSTANTVASVCTTNLIALTAAGTGITAASILILTNAIVAFTPRKNAPDAKKKTNSNITKLISTTDKNNFVIIRKALQPAMLVFKASDPDLYNDFMKLTEITNPATRLRKSRIVKATLSVTFINDQTDEFIENVSGKLTGIKGTFLSDANGLVTKEVPLGAYLIKSVAVDFAKNNTAITVPAEGLVIIIRMTPLED